MKQFVFRRFSTSTGEGYGSLCSEDISPAQSAQLSAESDPFGVVPAAVRPWVSRMCVYKQYALDDRAVALYCGYTDPRGDRGSILGHDLLADDPVEIEELAGHYPLLTDFFDDAKQSGSLYQSKLASVDLSLPAFAGRQWAEVLPLVQSLFGEHPQLLEQFIEALMMVACASAPEFIVALFPKGTAPDAVSEKGRQVMEALYACLPPVLIRRIGYLSFSCGYDNTSRFKVRFSEPTMIELSGIARSYVCLFDLETGQVQTPANMALRAGEYSRQVASLLLSGCEADIGRIDQLRRVVDDVSYLGSKDIADDVALRYAVLVDPTQISAEMRTRMILWQARVLQERESGGEQPGNWEALHRRVAEFCLNPDAQNPDERRIVFQNAARLFDLDPAAAEPYVKHYTELLHLNRLGDMGGLANPNSAFARELQVRQLLNPDWGDRYIQQTLAAMPFGAPFIQRWQHYRRIVEGRDELIDVLDGLLTGALQKAMSGYPLDNLLTQWGGWLGQISQVSPALVAKLQPVASERLLGRLMNIKKVSELDEDGQAAALKALIDLDARDSQVTRALSLAGGLRETSADRDLMDLMDRYFRTLRECPEWANLLTGQARGRLQRLLREDPIRKDPLIAFGLMAYAWADARGVSIDVGGFKQDLDGHPGTRVILRDLVAYSKKATGPSTMPVLTPGCYRVLTRKDEGRGLYSDWDLWAEPDRPDGPAPAPRTRPHPSPRPRLDSKANNMRMFIALCAAMVFSLGFLISFFATLRLMGVL